MGGMAPFLDPFGGGEYCWIQDLKNKKEAKEQVPLSVGFPSFADRDRFDHDRFFFHHHRNRAFFAFDFAAFGFSWWYPYPYPYYYDYPYAYSCDDYGQAYDEGYWNNLAVAVQSELARRGYYHDGIDGIIAPGSRNAIRAFQAARGLPVTGLIDPNLLNALGISYRNA
jgi:putative peptidoglycan binding protein